MQTNNKDSKVSYTKKVEIKKGESTNRLAILAELTRLIPEDLFEKQIEKKPTFFPIEKIVSAKNFTITINITEQ
jgi:hypothetical protein